MWQIAMKLESTFNNNLKKHNVQRNLRKIHSSEFMKCFVLFCFNSHVTVLNRETLQSNFFKFQIHLFFLKYNSLLHSHNAITLLSRIKKKNYILTSFPGESFGLKFIPNQSDLFRNLYPSQSGSIRKNFSISFDPNW